jgi:predicted Rdx family selenoprotein
MITQFSVGCSRTINLGNFESLRVEATITVDCPEDGDFPQMKLAAQTQLRQLLEETYRAQHEDRKKKSA